MKILLIRHPGLKSGLLFGHYTSDFPPLGLQYLAASLKKNGHEVEIINYSMEDFSKEHLKNYIKSSDAVGMTVYSLTLDQAKKISKAIYEIDPKIPFIIGGPHCIFLQEKSLIDLPEADICVVGEGEKTIINIIKYLEGKKKLSDISGIFYREDNEIKKGKDIEIIQDLDELPFPDRHITEKYDSYLEKHSSLFKPKFTTMESSRGCPLNCRFCSRYGNAINNYNYRQRSAESVAKEIIELDKKYCSVMIVDDNFLQDKNRAHKIMDTLIETKTKIHIYVLGARVTSAEENLYKKMKKANVKSVSFGIESGNQDVLDFYNKKITLKQIKKAVKLANKMGFIVQGTFILGAPIETKKHIKSTIKFANSLPLDTVSFSPLFYIIKSPLWEEAVKENKISSNERAIPADSNRGLGNFTPEELNKFVIYAYKKFYFRPSYFIRQFFRIIIRKDLKIIKYGLNFLISAKNIKFDDLVPEK